MSIRAAVIGLGVMGRNHARVLYDMEQVELAAVADPDPAALLQATRGRDVKAYTDYLALLATEHVDLAIIAVPTSFHREVALQSLRAGAHLLIEKPIAATTAEAEEIAQAAALLGRHVAVGHIERFNPAVVALKQRLSAGELGTMYRLHSRRMGPFPSRIRDVGVVIDLATHDVDIARYLLGAEPIRLHAETAQRIHTAHEDMLSALIRFDNHVVAQLDVNWLTPTKIRELSVTGERGMFLVNYLTQELTFFENDYVVDPALPDGIASVVEGRMVRYPVQPKEPLRAELENVVTAVESDRPPLVGPHDAIHALRIAQGLVAAGRTGDVLNLEPRKVAVPA